MDKTYAIFSTDGPKQQYSNILYYVARAEDEDGALKVMDEDIGLGLPGWIWHVYEVDLSEGADDDDFYTAVDGEYPYVHEVE